jgi:hypothetical protein
MWEEFKHTLGMIGIRLTGKTMSMSLTLTLISMKMIGAGGVIGAPFMLAIPIGIAIAGFIDHLDHKFDLDKMTQRYRDEVGARLEKNPATVTSRDLQQVADGAADKALPANPVLKQAVDRIHARHTLSFLSTIAAGTIAVGTGFLLLPVISSTLALAGCLFATALISNGVIERAATRALHLNEPTLNDRIAHLDERRGKVKEYELFTLATEANVGLAQQIQEQSGKSFRQMDVPQKVDAMERFSRAWNIPQITEDFNLGVIRSAELSFALVGQSSGVPKQEAPRPIREQMQEFAEKGREMGRAAWMHLRVRNHKTGQEEDKLVICHPQTGCAVLDSQASEKLLPLFKKQQQDEQQERMSFAERYQEKSASSELSRN